MPPDAGDQSINHQEPQRLNEHQQLEDNREAIADELEVVLLRLELFFARALNNKLHNQFAELQVAQQQRNVIDNRNVNADGNGGNAAEQD